MAFIAVGIFLLSFCLIYNTLVLFRIDEIMLKWNYAVGGRRVVTFGIALLVCSSIGGLRLVGSCCLL